MNSKYPSFHDGYLTGIDLAATCTTLRLRRSDGRTYELRLVDLEALQINDFREGNIIYDLEVISGRDPIDPILKERMERLFPSPHANAASKFHDAQAQFLTTRIASIKHGKAALVSISASYGADLVAFCASVELHELTEAVRQLEPDC